MSRADEIYTELSHEAQEVLSECPEEYVNRVIHLFKDEVYIPSAVECVRTVIQKNKNYLGDVINLLEKYAKDTFWDVEKIAHFIEKVAKFQNERLGDVINLFEKYENNNVAVINIVDYMDFLVIMYKERFGVVTEAFSKYSDVINRFRDMAAANAVLCIGNFAEFKKDRLEDVVNLLKIYEKSDRVAADVAEYLRTSLGENIGNVIEAFSKYSDVIKRFAHISNEAVECIGNVAARETTRERLEDVIDLLEKYENNYEVVKSVAGCIGEVAADEKARLEDTIEAFLKYNDFIMSFEGQAAGCVAECIGEVAHYDRGCLEDVVDLLKKYKSSKIAGTVAINVSFVASHDKERLGDVVETFSEYSDVISDVITSFEGQAAGSVAWCIREVAWNGKELLGDMADVLKKCVNNKAAGTVAEYVGWVAVDDKKLLKDVVGALKTISEGPEAYRKYQKEVLKKVVPDIQDDFFKYEKSYVISDIGAAKEANEKANKDLYERGLEIIRGIADGNIAVRLDWEHPEVLEQFLGDSAKEIAKNISKIKVSENTAKEMKKRLKENKGNDTEAKKWLEDYESRKKGVENEARERLREKLKAEYEILKQNCDIEKIKEYLNQFSQHFLGKGTAPAKQAKAISSSLVVNEGELSSNVAKIHVWEKSLDTKEMPTYEEFNCCVFNRDGKINKGLINYILNPAVQLLKFEIGDKSAMAIVAATKDKNGEDVLLLDSFESGKHIFERKGVAKAALQAIKDYAKAAGFKKVVVSANAPNNAPREFYESIDRKENWISLELPINAPNPFLEALEKGRIVEGKVFDLGAAEA